MPKNHKFIFNTEELNQAIDNNVKIAVLTDGAFVMLDRECDLSIFIKGDIKAGIELFGNASPRVICNGKVKVQIISRGTSRPNITLNDDSEAFIKTKVISSPNIISDDYSRIKVLAHENSSPNIYSIGSSVSMIVVCDNANPKVTDWPTEWKALRSDIYIGQRIVCFGCEEEAMESVRALYNEWKNCRNRFIACSRTPGAVPKVCPNVVHFRFRGGLIHFELPEGNGQEAWFVVLHALRNLTEEERNTMQRIYIQ
jgi:hypothetical protein